MHLSKKKKLILAWTIPTATVVAAAIIVPPIVISLENNKLEKLNNAPDLTPVSFNSMTEEQLANLVYNPSNYTINFFCNEIVDNTDLMNQVFVFENLNKKVDGNKIYWIDKNGVNYYIKSINTPNMVNGAYQTDGNGNYIFVARIQKEVSGKQKIYEQKISIPASSFASNSASVENFTKESAKKINDLFNVGNTNFSITITPDKKESIKFISDISSPSDLVISSNSNDQPFIKDPNKNNYRVKNLNYLGANVVISTPVNDLGNQSKLIWSSTDAYIFTGLGVFNKQTPAFVTLKEMYNNGQIIFLPELTSEESQGLSGEDIIDRKIQKLIFDPNISPYEYDEFGNKVPIKSNQAILVDVSLTENTTDSPATSSTKIISWNNLFASSDSEVLNAPEIQMQIENGPNGEMTYEQLMNPHSTWPALSNEQFWNTYIVPKTTPTDGLKYTITNVSFDPNDTYYKEAIINVEISHPSLLAKKEYECRVNSGFQSKAYVELSNEINAIIGPNKDVSLLNPTLSLVEGANVEELMNSNIMNPTELSKYVSITLPSGLTNAVYTQIFAKLVGNKLTVTYKISSTNDKTNYWKLNGIVQTVTAQLTLEVSSTS